MTTGNSRTAKSMLNSTSALAIYMLKLLLQFWSRKVFLDYLGTEILGLNSTAMNLLSFLNIAEMGLGEAVASTLYRPLFEKDREGVVNIISLQGMIYKRIACSIIFGAIVIMLFFPVIFKKMELPLWYAYSSFGVLLFSSLLGYFVNYKQILLSADQKNYKIQFYYNTILIAKVLVQTITISIFPYGYIWWLIWEFFFAILASASLSHIIKKSYPFLVKSPLPLKKLKELYPSVISKVKQLFFHKVSLFALTQLSPLILYLYTTLTEVALYGNYMLIYTGIILLVNAALNSVVASIGNFLEENPERRLLLFEELFSLRFFIAALLSFLFYTLTPSFISLWIGTQYLLPQSTLALLTILLFIQLTRQTIDNFIYAMGLFRDIWSPVIELSINVIASVTLGYFFGLNGIITGVILSLICIVMLWKPYFLFHRGWNVPVRLYWKTFSKHCIIATTIFVSALWVCRHIDMTGTGLSDLLVNSVLNFLSMGIPLAISLYVLNCGFKMFVFRLSKFLR